MQAARREGAVAAPGQGNTDCWGTRREEEEVFFKSEGKLYLHNSTIRIT